MKIKFVSGKLEKICLGYWNLTLYNKDNVVIYKATLDELTAAQAVNNHYEKLTIIK